MSHLGFPYHPYHPGELLKEELECRNLSQRSLAQKLGISYTMFNEILNAKRPVTTDFALLMEAALGVSSDILLRMQVSYSIQTARQDKTLTKQLENVRKICAVL